MQNKMYSEELQDLTREMLSHMKMAMMKNSDGSFGIYSNESNKISVVLIKTLKNYHFNSLEELLKAGWVID